MKYLVVENVDSVATVTINRPKVLNALDAETVGELYQLIKELSADSSVRVVILTGSGDRAFIAGADIAELSTLTPVSAQALAQRGHLLCAALETMDKPVIAAINGYALGGGCEIALACTLRIASDNAKLGQPEISLGLLPGYGGTQRLARLVGSGRALELMLTGEEISAKEAHRIGLVNRVVPASDLTTEAMALGKKLASKAPVAARAILSAVRDGLQMPLSEGCAYESSLFAMVAATDDWHEGTRAFLEKRQPTFKGS